MTKRNHLGMRILSLVLCLVCLGCTVLPATASEAEQKQQTLTTQVHNGAYYGATVIGQMEDGTEVTVLDRQGEFYKVDCYDMNGYIAMSQIVHNEDGKYYVNCKEGSSESRTMEYTDYADALTLRHSLFDLAKEQLGYPYVYGGARPGGFDCSGLTYYLYGQHGIQLHRTASQQLQDGIVVAKEGLQVGDLIFFRESWDSYPASHVGIYVGNNQIIHAGSGGIEYADLDFDYFAKYYLCARRIVNTSSAQFQEPATAITAVSALNKPATGRRTSSIAQN